MKLSDIFIPTLGNKFDMQNMSVGGKINFVSRNSNENGVVAQVEMYNEIEPYPAGLITVSLGGTFLLSSFVQNQPFYTAQNVAVLTPRVEMSLLEKLFWCYAIQSNRFRYSAFGREANRTLKDLILPDSIPDWVTDVEIKPVSTKVSSPEYILNTENWAWFKVSDLFDPIESGRYLSANEKTIEGTTKTIASGETNNGWTQNLNIPHCFNAGTITVARNGSVGAAFYQDEKYFATDDIRVWNAKKGKLSVFEGLFLCTIIRNERYRFAYGRKWGTERMKTSMIKLPVDSDGEPNWEYMESFIKSLPYSDRI